MTIEDLQNRDELIVQHWFSSWDDHRNFCGMVLHHPEHSTTGLILLSRFPYEIKLPQKEIVFTIFRQEVVSNPLWLFENYISVALHPVCDPARLNHCGGTIVKLSYSPTTSRTRWSLWYLHNLDHEAALMPRIVFFVTDSVAGILVGCPTPSLAIFRISATPTPRAALGSRVALFSNSSASPYLTLETRRPPGDTTLHDIETIIDLYWTPLIRHSLEVQQNNLILIRSLFWSQWLSGLQRMV